ncbi:MAG: hypothetical protein ACXV8J_06945, partial [Methylobacter sp.]
IRQRVTGKIRDFAISGVILIRRIIECWRICNNSGANKPVWLKPCLAFSSVNDGENEGMFMGYCNQAIEKLDLEE